MKNYKLKIENYKFHPPAQQPAGSSADSRTSLPNIHRAAAIRNFQFVICNLKLNVGWR